MAEILDPPNELVDTTCLESAENRCSSATVGTLTSWQLLAQQVSHTADDESDEQLQQPQPPPHHVHHSVLECSPRSQSWSNSSTLARVTPRPHQFFYKEYRVLETIGKGAFGTVSLAVRRSDGKQLVAKEIQIANQASLSPKQAISIMSEVHVLAGLKHPNIVRFNGDCFLDSRFLIVIMEHCNAGDLAGLIKARAGKPWSEPDLMFLFVQVCLALHYVHMAGILHRDLKTSNILANRPGTSTGGTTGSSLSAVVSPRVSRQPSSSPLSPGSTSTTACGTGSSSSPAEAPGMLPILKLADFGVAKAGFEDDGSMAGSTVGTPHYLSPEMCDGKRYGKKSDMWALGCILYEMAALKKAFEAPNIGGIYRKIAAAEYAPLPAGYSSELQQLVAALLARDARDRPTTVEVLDLPYIRQHLSVYLDFARNVPEAQPEVLLATLSQQQPDGGGPVARPLAAAASPAGPPAEAQAASGCLSKSSSTRASDAAGGSQAAPSATGSSIASAFTPRGLRTGSVAADMAQLQAAGVGSSGAAGLADTRPAGSPHTSNRPAAPAAGPAPAATSDVARGGCLPGTSQTMSAAAALQQPTLLPLAAAAATTPAWVVLQGLQAGAACTGRPPDPSAAEQMLASSAPAASASASAAAAVAGAAAKPHPFSSPMHAAAVALACMPPSHTPTGAAADGALGQSLLQKRLKGDAGHGTSFSLEHWMSCEPHSQELLIAAFRGGSGAGSTAGSGSLGPSQLCHLSHTLSLKGSSSGSLRGPGMDSGAAHTTGGRLGAPLGSASGTPLRSPLGQHTHGCQQFASSGGAAALPGEWQPQPHQGGSNGAAGLVGGSGGTAPADAHMQQLQAAAMQQPHMQAHVPEAATPGISYNWDPWMARAPQKALTAAPAPTRPPTRQQAGAQRLSGGGAAPEQAPTSLQGWLADEASLLQQLQQRRSHTRSRSHTGEVAASNGLPSLAGSKVLTHGAEDFGVGLAGSCVVRRTNSSNAPCWQQRRLTKEVAGAALGGAAAPAALPYGGAGIGQEEDASAAGSGPLCAVQGQTQSNTSTPACSRAAAAEQPATAAPPVAPLSRLSQAANEYDDGAMDLAGMVKHCLSGNSAIFRRVAVEAGAGSSFELPAAMARGGSLRSTGDVTSEGPQQQQPEQLQKQPEQQAQQAHAGDSSGHDDTALVREQLEMLAGIRAFKARFTHHYSKAQPEGSRLGAP